MQKDSLLNRADHIYKDISFLSSTRELSIQTLSSEKYPHHVVNYNGLYFVVTTLFIYVDDNNSPRLLSVVARLSCSSNMLEGDTGYDAIIHLSDVCHNIQFSYFHKLLIHLVDILLFQVLSLASKSILV